MRTWGLLDPRTRLDVQRCESCMVKAPEPGAEQRVYICDYHDGYDDAVDAVLADLRTRAEDIPTVEVDGVKYLGMVWWTDVLKVLGEDAG
jgi:hypothetical protein